MTRHLTGFYPGINMWGCKLQGRGQNPRPESGRWGYWGGAAMIWGSAVNSPSEVRDSPGKFEICCNLRPQKSLQKGLMMCKSYQVGGGIFNSQLIANLLCQWKKYGVTEEPLRCYIAQYNKCGLRCVGLEYIASERSENRHFRPPHSHLTPPVQRTPANICIKLTSLETRIPGLHFCRW